MKVIVIDGVTYAIERDSGEALLPDGRVVRGRKTNIQHVEDEE